MDEIADQTSNPRGNTYYCAVAFFALLFGTIFTWGIFHSANASVVSLSFGVVMVAVCILGALQALERLLRPENAKRRSRAFSASARAKIRTAYNMICSVAAVGFVVGAVIHIVGGGPARDVAMDINQLSCVLFFIGFCLADLIGERGWKQQQ